jgi:hypothetical protein
MMIHDVQCALLYLYTHDCSTGVIDDTLHFTCTHALAAMLTAALTHTPPKPPPLNLQFDKLTKGMPGAPKKLTIKG